MKLVIAATSASGRIYLQRPTVVSSSRPQSAELVDTAVWRILDQLGLPTPCAYRWKAAVSGTAQAPS